MKRMAYLDYLRALAIIWMVIFHFTYDLKIFGLNQVNFGEGFWFAFPRLIAGTFLFCVGISLHLTHGQKLNLNSLKKRSIKLGFGALVVSFGTYLLFPDQWIFFGTLHCILVASLLGALICRNRLLSFILLFAILIGEYLTPYDIKWVGRIIGRPSMDFIPIYPWFWPVLLGILLAPYLAKIERLQNLPTPSFITSMSQYSLKIYLIHQPVLYGLVWGRRSLL